MSFQRFKNYFAYHSNEDREWVGMFSIVMSNNINIYFIKKQHKTIHFEKYLRTDFNQYVREHGTCIRKRVFYHFKIKIDSHE